MTGPTKIDPRNPQTTTAPADAGESRRRLAMVWAGGLAILGTLVVVLALIRVITEAVGHVISQGEEQRLQLAAAYHGALAVGGAIAYRGIHRKERIGFAWMRALACLTPFLLLGSVDRIAAYFIPPHYYKQTIWLLDHELGWRLRPNSSLSSSPLLVELAA